MLAVVTHLGRPAELEQTLDALGTPAGVGRTVVISDGPYDGPRLARGWELFLLPRQGERGAMFWTMGLARRAREELVMVANDVVLEDAPVTYALEVPHDCAALSFFHPTAAPGRRHPHVERVFSGEWRNAQAAKYPARTLALLEELDTTAVAKETWPHGFAQAFGELVAAAGVPFVGVAWPNRAEHLGRARSPWTVAAIPPERKHG